MAKEVLFFVDVCRRRKLHTNSRSTAAEIQPLDCNNDTTKQQELGYSCIVTKSSCHGLIDFIAVLVTKQQEVSSINKAEEFFLFSFGLFFSLLFVRILFLYFLFLLFFYYFDLHQQTQSASAKSFSGPRFIVFRHMSNCSNE